MTSYCFDVEVINGGEDDNISIGLNSDGSTNSPGMNDNTIGIYGVDGSVLRNGEEVFEALWNEALLFTTGDHISCRVVRSKISNDQFTITSCHFSKNGVLMESKFNVGGKKHYPAVGLHSPGAAVRITLNTNEKPGKFILI